MDEPHTHKMLDALADLFLTGTVESKPFPQASSTDAASDSGQHDRETQDVDQPPPLRLHREDAPDPNDGQPPTSIPEPKTVTRIEAVFLGNLPGFGGPWMAQYAYRVAKQHGPVAIIHVDADELVIERVTAEREDQPHAEPQHLGSSSDDVKDNLLKQLRRDVSVIMFKLPTPPTAQTLRLAETITNWTLLCGTDDAAMVGAYRLLKQLAEHHEAGEGARCCVNLMTMGSDEAPSRAVAEKLNLAAASFLMIPVELIGWQPQMVPVNVQSLGALPATPTSLADVQSVVHGQKSQNTFTTTRPQEHVTELPSTVDEPQDEEAKEPDAINELTEQEHAEAPIEVTPITQSVIRNQDSAEPDLVGFVGSVHRLDARCPHQPQIKLALDTTGRLQLLCRHEGDAVELCAAIVDLLDARGWAQQHLDLLQLTQPQMSFDMESQPALHLFTGSAKTSTALVGRLGKFLTVHLLQQVQVGNAATWISSALN